MGHRAWESDQSLSPFLEKCAMEDIFKSKNNEHSIVQTN